MTTLARGIRADFARAWDDPLFQAHLRGTILDPATQGGILFVDRLTAAAMSRAAEFAARPLYGYFESSPVPERRRHRRRVVLAGDDPDILPARGSGGGEA